MRSPLATSAPSSVRNVKKPWTSPSRWRTATGSALAGACSRHARQAIAAVRIMLTAEQCECHERQLVRMSSGSGGEGSSVRLEERGETIVEQCAGAAIAQARDHCGAGHAELNHEQPRDEG